MYSSYIPSLALGLFFASLPSEAKTLSSSYTQIHGRLVVFPLKDWQTLTNTLKTLHHNFKKKCELPNARLLHPPRTDLAPLSLPADCQKPFFPIPFDCVQKPSLFSTHHSFHRGQSSSNSSFRSSPPSFQGRDLRSSKWSCSWSTVAKTIEDPHYSGKGSFSVEGLKSQLGDFWSQVEGLWPWTASQDFDFTAIQEAWNVSFVQRRRLSQEYGSRNQTRYQRSSN